MGKPIPAVTGATVRLLHDITTRGRKKYRAGLKMKIASHHGEYLLKVWVRNKPHFIRLAKKYAHRDFEVIAAAPKKEDADAD